MNQSIIVIGGGIIGVTSAIELARRGHSVTLIEAETPGGEQAASYGNAGFLSVQSVIPSSTPGMWKNVPNYLMDPLGPLAIRVSYFPKVLPWLMKYLLAGATKAKVRTTATALNALLKDAPVLHTALAEAAGCPELIEHKGLLHPFLSRAEYEKEAFGWQVRREVGVAFEELEGDELRRRHPELPEIYTFGVFIPDAGRCRNPGAYVASLAAYAQSLGVTLLRERASGLTQEASGKAAVVTDAGKHIADHIVLAAGVRSRALAKTLGDDTPLESERGYHVSLPEPEANFGSAYMAADAKIVVNGMAGFLRVAGQIEFAGIEAEPNWKRADILRAHMQRLYPKLKTQNAKVWMGHRPSLPDGLPCIGPCPKAPNVTYAFGHAHTGLVGSARTARLVAQLVSGEPTDIDLTPFSPARFGGGAV